MSMLISFIILVAVCQVTIEATDQGQVYMLAFTNLTTDNGQLKSIQEFILSTNTEKVTKVGIFFPDQGAREQQVLWSGNDYTYSTSTTVDLAVQTEAGVTKKGILLVSDNPITVFANKAAQGTTDGYLALPITKRSKEFFVPSFDFIPLGHATYAIAAVYNDTCVEAFMLENGKYKRVLNIHMNEAEVHHSFYSMKDVTGTFINSTRPIAVFGGHECAQVPKGKKFCDNLIEQVPPVADWGKEFYMGAILGRNRVAGYTVRILASQDDTEVKFTKPGLATETSTVPRGGFTQHNVSDTQDMSRVVCSKPCLVVQYNTGMRNGGPGEIQTDAWMTIIPPITKMGCQGNVTFGTSSFYHMGAVYPFSSYVTVVVETSSKNDITIDGARPTWTDVSEFGWSWTGKSITPGFHSIVSSGTRKFSPFVYGHALVEPTGYGYPTCYDVADQVHYGSWFVRYNEPLPANHTYGGGGGQGSGGQSGPLCTDPDSMYRPNDVRDVTLGAPLNTFTLSIPLKNTGVGSCGAHYLSTFESRGVELLESFNNDICRKSMCQSRQYPMGINSIVVKLGPDSGDGSVKSFDIAVDIGSHPDEPIGNYLACKKELTNYLSKNAGWTLPESKNGCSPLEFDEQKIKILPQWACYAS